MALTIASVKHNVVGGSYEHIVTITGDSSYATGGEVLADVDINALLPKLGGKLVANATSAGLIQFFVSERDTSGRELALDRTNFKILFYAAGAEIANATNLSAVTIRAIVRYGQVS